MDTGVSSPESVPVSDGDDTDDGSNGILVLSEDEIDPVDEEGDTGGDPQYEDAPLIVGEDRVEKEDTPTDDVKSPFMPSGDSLRGIGVTLVILYHMGYEQFKNAWFVISLFFSLSGFIMTKNTVEQFERRGQVDVLKFWAKRISRLFPALLLTLIVIMLSQKSPFRQNDGSTFQREATDIWYATLFLTNYNIAYNQVDDYFEEFSTPSITRHLWTLSIEEQYYIIWPLVLFIITTTGAWMSKNNENYDKVGQDKANDPYTISGTSKVCVRAILMLDIVVMAASYMSSTITIKNYGMTQAYYSTMCRMGDIAAGGFTYSFVRLVPFLSRRWFRDPSLPPMSLTFRVILELLGLILIILLVTVPMIQTPEDEMLEIYFKWFRLLISLMLSGVVANTIQLSEPLPRWAIVSKIVTFKPLIIVGVISYGVYVFHWPLLVYFGDPRGINRKKAERGWDEPYDGVLGYEGRNVVLFVTVMIIGYFSFFYFELPCLTFSRATVPRKTITFGFISIGITLLIHWLISKDLAPMTTFENDAEVINDNLDHRFTPLIFATDQIATQHHALEALDYQTRTSFVSKNLHESVGFNWWDQILLDYNGPEFADADSFIIMACTNAVDQSPCDHPEIWRDNTYWIWLDAPHICGKKPKSQHVDFQERCEDVLTFSEMSESDLAVTDSSLAILSLFLGVDDTFPGVMNQNTMGRLESNYERGDSNIFSLTNSTAEGEDWDPIKITLLGDSVGVRIGMFWRDSIELDTPGLEDENFPSLSLTNLAAGGLPTISYFACLSTHPKYQYDQCHKFKKDHASNVLNGFDLLRPNVVVVHDGHIVMDDGRNEKDADFMALATTFERIMAFNIMLDEAKKNGVEQMIMMTLSRVEKKPKKLYDIERDYHMRIVDTLACPEGDPSGMWVTFYDWERLVCPTIDSGLECPQNVHGFETILPDGIHPAGDSGLWLTRQALALVVSSVSKYSLPDKFGTYSSWDETIENPISKRMLKLAPPDGDPTLKDLVSSYYLCPYKDLQALEKDYNHANFPKYETYKDSEHHVGIRNENEYVNFDAPLYSDTDEELKWYTHGPKIATRYDHRVVLRGPDRTDRGNNAVIDWAVNQTHIRMAVAARTTGYVGFGIADSGGGFKGADMVFLESADSDSLRDTYTTEEGKLQTDKGAGDWEFVGSEIVQNYMVFETVRLLDTGDSQDRKIINDSNRLVPPHRILAAWGDSNTVDTIEVNHHKGTLRFFQDNLEPFDSMMERGAEGTISIQAVNYQVSELETDYYFDCLTKSDMIARGLPNNYETMHMIGFEPIIQTKNRAFVHHFLLFGYYNDNCGGQAMTSLSGGELMYYWGDGLSNVALPDFLGLPFYGEGSLNSFKIQTHYHNPLKRSDIIDSSGFRLYWTSKLRETDLGVFTVGDPYVKKKYTQLGRGLSRHDFDCPSSCTSTFMDKPITVFQEVHHAHGLGVQTVIDQFRDGKKVRSGKVEYFDWYTNGNPLVVQEEFTIEPGDSFTTSCYYRDGDGLNSVFGFGARDEMCMGSYLYYPRVDKDIWMCGYDIVDRQCATGYKHKKVPDINSLGRTFPFGDQG